MDELQRLLKNGATVNIDFNKKELVVTKRYPVIGRLPTVTTYRTQQGKRLILNALLSKSPTRSGTKILKHTNPMAIDFGKTPRTRSAGKLSRSQAR